MSQNWPELIAFHLYCSIKENSIWVITHGDTRKIPRCNVKLIRKDSIVDEEEVSKDNEKVSIKFQDDKGVKDQVISEEKATWRKY